MIEIQISSWTRVSDLLHEKQQRRFCVNSEDCTEWRLDKAIAFHGLFVAAAMGNLLE
jgi:hypothetical protein